MISVGVRSGDRISVDIRDQDHISISATCPVRYYGGDYAVTPSKDSCILSTKGLCMAKNITVAPIPYSETPNSAGGTTVSIG